MTAPAEKATFESLIASRERFLSYLLSRADNSEVAHDILQAGFAKAFEESSGIRDAGKAEAWFYRLLRNALSDYRRRKALGERAIQSRTRESSAGSAEGNGRQRSACLCLRRVVPTLQPPYAEILRRTALEGERIADFARSKKIDPNAAMVRLHRARKALQRRLERECCGCCRETGCMDCTCSE